MEWKAWLMLYIVIVIAVAAPAAIVGQNLLNKLVEIKRELEALHSSLIDILSETKD